MSLDASLKSAFSEMRQHDAEWIAVLDRDRYVGVLTPASLHDALRRSVDGRVVTFDGSHLGSETT